MSISVFIADDHTVVRDGLRLLIETQSDMKVVSDASNGREAARQVLHTNPDVVIMDLAMPELNGVEATRQIRENCPATKVIILSMHSSSEHIFQALKAGAHGYLLKESAGMEVISAIRVVHSGKRYLSEKIGDQMIDEYIHNREIVETGSPLSKLSTREREILQLVVEGKSSIEIAQTLFISPKTVETYRSRLMQKLGINDLPGLIKFAIQHGITSL
jgi:DNA-binding NarL/FixJ family response regulator